MDEIFCATSIQCTEYLTHFHYVLLDNNFLLGLGDSYTSGGGKQSYPLVAAGLLNWSGRNFAVGGSKMGDIPSQLATAKSVLANVTHVVLTTSGNDLGVGKSVQEIILHDNYTDVEKRIYSLQPQLVATYKTIQNAVRPGTKIFALPYVDLFSVGHIIPNEDDTHKMMHTYSAMVKAAATEANIGFIESVTEAFVGHEMYSADPYCGGLTGPNAMHPNAKGYIELGQVVADYLKSN